MDGARKFTVEQQKFDDPARRDATVAFAIHLECTRGAQDSGPLHVVEWRANVLRRTQQDEILHIEDAGGFVRALEHPAEMKKMPRLSMRHGGGGDAVEEVVGVLDLREKLV